MFNSKIRLLAFCQIIAILCEPILSPAHMVYATEQSVEVEDSEISSSEDIITEENEAFLFEQKSEYEAFEEGTEKIVVIDEISIDGMQSNDELFEGFVDKHFYGMYDIAPLARLQLAGDRLQGTNKYIYDQLKLQIQRVAQFGGATNNFQVVFTGSDAWNQVKDFGQDDLQSIMDALLVDIPYELYWYDKTEGIKCGISQSNTNVIMTFSCSVVQSYRKDGNSHVVTDDVSKVSAAATEARRVANLYINQSQTEKLESFLAYICNAVSYNYDVVIDDNAPYGDPWQLIYVFDKDSTTNVVCEGYSKAFKYLCDMTGEACYLASGYLGPINNGEYGSHMWNIVTLNNGANLLVDSTNCDSQKGGYHKQLFLVMGEYVASGPVSVNNISLDGYQNVGGSGLNYYYALGLRETLGDGILTLRQAEEESEISEIHLSIDWQQNEGYRIGKTIGEARRQLKKLLKITIPGVEENTIQSEVYMLREYNSVEYATNDSDIITSGTKYVLSLLITLSGDNKFISNQDAIKATLNGEAQTLSFVNFEGRNNVNIRFTLTDPTEGLIPLNKNIYIADENIVPGVGKAIPTTISTAYDCDSSRYGEAVYSINNVSWRHEDSESVVDNGSFTYGRYTLTFDIVPNDGYVLPMSNGTYDGTVYINNSSARIITASNEKLQVSYTFPKLIEEVVLRFEVNGGDSLPENDISKTVVYNEKIGELPNPTRTGYTFDGWYTVLERNGTVSGEKIDADTICKYVETTYVYAKWIPETYTVTFKGNGVTISEEESSKEVIYDASYGNLPSPEREGYDFIGWFTQKEGGVQVKPTDIHSIAQDLHLYAHWEEKKTDSTEGGSDDGIEPEKDIWGSILECDRVLLEADYDARVPEGMWICVGEGEKARVWERLQTPGKELQVDFNGAAITFPDMRIYDGNHLLSKADYTVSYANNKAVATFDSAKAPRVTITTKGNYTGAMYRTFTINGVEATTAISKFAVSVKWPNLQYNGQKKKAEEVVVRQNRTAEPLHEGEDFDIVYSPNVDAGKVTMSIIGKGEYYGIITKTYTITKKPFKVSKAETVEIECPETIPYGVTTLKIVVQDPTLTSPRILEEGIDYTYKLSSVKAGKAKVTITGKGNYSGSIQRELVIEKKDLGNTDIKLSAFDTAYQAKGMRKPVVILKDGDKTLKSGTDYTLEYRYVDKVNVGSVSKEVWKEAGALVSGQDVLMPGTKISVIVKGKGNYTGTISSTISVVESYSFNQFDEEEKIGNISVLVSPVKYQEKPGICKPSITVMDAVRGTKLKAGTDYVIDHYEYVDATGEGITVMNNKLPVTRHAEDTVDGKDVVPVGTTINAIIKGKGIYTGGGENAFIVAPFQYLKDISKASVKVTDQIFNGKEIEPSKSAFTVLLDKTLRLTADDYDIVSCSNNIKKGTATVVIQGKGIYTGQKKATFKIVARNVNYTIQYDANGGTGKTMTKSVIAEGKPLKANTYKKQGYTFAGWSLEPEGEIVYKDKAIFTTTQSYGGTITLYAKWE